MLSFLMSVWLAAPPPAALSIRQFEVRGIDTATQQPYARRIQLATPKGWTAEVDPRSAILRLGGPDGVGKMVVAVFTHPSQLTPILSELKAEHPGAAPSPPQPMELPSIRASMGERATRFQITGFEVGEMVMLEKRGAIVLYVTIVEPNAWEALQPSLQKAYASVRVDAAELPSVIPSLPKKRAKQPKRLRQSMTL